jgi:hypothetical protein
VLSGGSIEKLKEILGHYSVIVTERYAHLRPDLFPAADLGLIALELKPRVALSSIDQRAKNGAIGHSLATRIKGQPPTIGNKIEKTGAAL